MSQQETTAVPNDLLEQIYQTLRHYGNEDAYRGKRTGGVLTGCPRGPVPTPQDLVYEAQLMTRKMEEQVRPLMTPNV